MDSSAFDRLTRLVVASPSRRSLAGFLLGSIGGLIGLAEVGAAPCPAGTKRCHGRCIPKRACCMNADCPRGSGKVCRNGRCLCPRSRQRCRKRCIPKTACCGGCRAGLVCKQGTCCVGTSATLTAALAPDGPAVIRLCPRTTYPGNFTVAQDRVVTLIGAGAGSTILNGGGTGQVLIVSPNAFVVVRDLQITNGRGQGALGGGVANSGTLTLRRCLVTGNQSTLGGGGILNIQPSSSLTLDSSSVISNLALIGGGIYNIDGLVTLQGTSLVAGNIASETGGGIRVTGPLSRVVLADATLIAHNSANLGDAESGGGIFNNPNNPGVITIAPTVRVVSNLPNDCTNATCPS